MTKKNKHTKLEQYSIKHNQKIAENTDRKTKKILNMQSCAKFRSFKETINEKGKTKIQFIRMHCKNRNCVLCKQNSMNKRIDKYKEPLQKLIDD